MKSGEGGGGGGGGGVLLPPPPHPSITAPKEKSKTENIFHDREDLENTEGVFMMKQKVPGNFSKICKIEQESQDYARSRMRSQCAVRPP